MPPSLANTILRTFTPDMKIINTVTCMINVKFGEDFDELTDHPINPYIHVVDKGL